MLFFVWRGCKQWKRHKALAAECAEASVRLACVCSCVSQCWDRAVAWAGHVGQPCRGARRVRACATGGRPCSGTRAAGRDPASKGREAVALRQQRCVHGLQLGTPKPAARLLPPQCLYRRQMQSWRRRRQTKKMQQQQRRSLESLLWAGPCRLGAGPEISSWGGQVGAVACLLRWIAPRLSTTIGRVQLIISACWLILICCARPPLSTACCRKAAERRGAGSLAARTGATHRSAPTQEMVTVSQVQSHVVIFRCKTQESSGCKARWWEWQQQQRPWRQQGAGSPQRRQRRQGMACIMHDAALEGCCRHPACTAHPRSSMALVFT